MKKTPNIILYFVDQQRADTLTSEIMPNLYNLASTQGAIFENCYTCQPVCGPARACLQTGLYSRENGCVVNGIALKNGESTLADYFNNNGYNTAYIGKWHLASNNHNGGIMYMHSAVPREKQGGYQYWRAADLLEFTSHGYGGYVFDNDGNKLSFDGYRADAINDFALEYLNNYNSDKPFFLFISQLEPHHQNDHGHFEGYKETIKSFKDYPIPADLTALKGNYKNEYPDYLSAINRLDYNFMRIIDNLKQSGKLDDTIIIYTADHGCHFKTRNSEYKRSAHDGSIHIPLAIIGGKFSMLSRRDELVSLIDIPPTLLDLAGIAVPEKYQGISISKIIDGTATRTACYIDISESHIAKAIRTTRYTYEESNTGIFKRSMKCKKLKPTLLYDNLCDPRQLNNLVDNPEYKDITNQLHKKLHSKEKI